MENITGLTNIVVLGLAVSQVVEVMRHSKLTLSLRTWALGAVSRGGLLGFAAKILTCPFCLSHWVAGGFTLLLLVSMWAFWPAQWLAVVFAATRVANLSNDIFYNSIRTFKYEIEEVENLEDNDGDPDESPEITST